MLTQTAGCSGHIHVSLRDQSGRNIFAAPSARADAKFEDSRWLSVECEHFIAGILAGLPDVMPCLVPTVNGYKRLVEVRRRRASELTAQNFWAPTRVAWGYESRLASIRVISPPLASAASTRIEVRVGGADINSYLALAAIIGLGMHGIENKLELSMPPISSAASGPPLHSRA